MLIFSYIKPCSGAELIKPSLHNRWLSNRFAMNLLTAATWLVACSKGATLSLTTADPIPPTEIDGLASNLAWVGTGDFARQHRKRQDPVPARYSRNTYDRPSIRLTFEVIAQGYTLGDPIPVTQLPSGRYVGTVEESRATSAVGEDLGDTWPAFLLEYFPPEASTRTKTCSQEFAAPPRSARKPRAFRPLIYSLSARMNSTGRIDARMAAAFAQVDASATLRLPAGGIDGVLVY